LPGKDNRGGAIWGLPHPPKRRSKPLAKLRNARSYSASVPLIPAILGSNKHRAPVFPNTRSCGKSGSAPRLGGL